MRRRFWLWLFFFYVLQIETTVAGLLAFAGSERAVIWYPVVVFAAMTVGSGLALLPKLHGRALPFVFSWLAGPLVLLFVGLRFFPEAHLLFASLPFVSLGLIMAALYAEFALWELMRGFFVAGLVFYLALALWPEGLAEYSTWTLILSVGGIGLLTAGEFKAFARSALVSLFLLGLVQFGYFVTPSRMHIKIRNFAGAYAVAPSRFHGLFRTDLLYLPKQDALLMQANGRRYAILQPKFEVDAALGARGPFNMGHDSPYVLRRPRRVLVIGSAEGSNVISALANHVPEIWALDINPGMFEFSLKEARAFSGGFYNHAEVHRLVGEGRNFLETTAEKFDLITLQGVQTGTRTSRENAALIESFLFTEEALHSLWNHLLNHGMIFFEEYGDQDQESPLMSLAAMARQTLGLSAAQVKLIAYVQPAENPRSKTKARRVRQALFISRDPILEDRFQTLLKMPPGAQAIDFQPVRQGPTDNRPVYVLGSLNRQMPWLCLAALLGGGGVFLSGRSRQKTRPNAALVVIGMIFIIFVTSISGPATLILGNPTFVVPLLYGGLLGGSLFGAWLVLKFGLRPRRMDAAALFLFLLALSLLLAPLKDLMVGMASPQARFAAIFLLGFVFGALIEVPYVRMLDAVEGWPRAYRFFIESAGTFIGIPLAFLLQVEFGCREALAAATLLSFVLFFLLPRAFRESGV